MGTNYMWRIALPTGGWLDRRDDPLVHIGKGTAAGMVCFRCNARTHSYRSNDHDYVKCMTCGDEKIAQLGYTAEATAKQFEARYGRSLTIKPGGMFVWAQQPPIVRAACERLHSEPIVTDGDAVWTGRGFLGFLEECYQVWDLTQIGTWFS